MFCYKANYQSLPRTNLVLWFKFHIFALTFLHNQNRRVKMIKKHLFTCTLVLAIFVISKLFIWGKRAEDKQQIVIPTNVPQVVDKQHELSDDDNHDRSVENELSFATEKVPIGDVKIEKKLNRILKAHAYSKIRTHKLHSKAALWFPKIEPILKAYGIPEDFKYLPLVESGLMEGTSHKGASGQWQFMPATARSFGLKVNKEVDERHDVKKATVAACKYLNALYKEFGNWTLVAAAYNVGEGRLKRAINVQNQESYYKLKLNAETSSYVYKLISVKEIIENPKDHGYKGQKGKSNVLMAIGEIESESNQM